MTIETAHSFHWYFSIMPVRQQQITQETLQVFTQIVSSPSYNVIKFYPNKVTSKLKTWGYLMFPLILQYLVWWLPRCRWQLGSPLPPPRVAPSWRVAPCCWLIGSASSCPGRWAGLQAVGPHLHSEEALRGTAPLEASVCRRSCLRGREEAQRCLFWRPHVW